MHQPSQAMASIVRQTGLEDFANAITVDSRPACRPEVHTPARCEQLAMVGAREQMLADIAAIGFALFAATVVGRIAVTFVGLFGMCLRYTRARARVRASAVRHISQGGLLDG
ncbi:hypothetical protein [Novosphingobium soli]|uniref:Uncharacterized protein n=1 Tax=Novosphingobium soli TaxID=574956 RepID=A0ABV6CY49_9SPHN